MTDLEYNELKKRYGAENGIDWDGIWRRLAFFEFECALEEFCSNEKEDWEGNDGESLEDITPSDVERIIDDYLARTEELFCRIGTEEMRSAIQDVTGLIC